MREYSGQKNKASSTATLMPAVAGRAVSFTV